MWSYLQVRLLVTAIVIGFFDCAGASTKDTYTGARLGHRIVQTRYGRLHGLILPLDNFRLLRSVEVFLGVPYATPPTKQNRFVVMKNIQTHTLIFPTHTALAQHVPRRPGRVYEYRILTVQCVHSVCPTFKMRRPRLRRCQRVAWST